MKISIQGIKGSYSDQASSEAYPLSEKYFCNNFKDAISLLNNGEVDLAFLPIENSTAFRVAGVHNLLRDLKNINFIKEVKFSVRHALLGIKGAKKTDIKEVYSHPQALMQCVDYCAKNNIKQTVKPDTAGSAKLIAEKGNKKIGAIASTLTSEIYNLDVLEKNIQDKDNNTTTFVALKKTNKNVLFNKNKKYKSAMIFTTRDISASLYKALGGFATNNVNLSKLESYTGTQKAEFFIIFEGHLEDKKVKKAIEELEFFAEKINFLGSYSKTAY